MSTELTFHVRDFRDSGWYGIRTSFLTRFGSVLGPYGIAVYNGLCSFAHNTTQQCWRVIKQLVSHRIICSENQYRTNDAGRAIKTSNMYSLLAETEWLDEAIEGEVPAGKPRFNVT